MTLAEKLAAAERELDLARVECELANERYRAAAGRVVSYREIARLESDVAAARAAAPMRRLRELASKGAPTGQAVREREARRRTA